MLILGSVSLLLLICAVNGDCPDQPEVRQCMVCNGVVDCHVSSDNRLVNCTAPSDPSICKPTTCSSAWQKCMTLWSRSDSRSPWTLFSLCVTVDPNSSPCDYTETCIHPEEVDPVDTGSFQCHCHGHLCNRHFLAGTITPVAMSSEIGSGSTSSNPEPSSVVAMTSTIIPVTTNTPVIYDERDCITDCSAPPNCTLSVDNRSMKCVVDDSCLNNVTRCDSRTSQTCAASWRRNSSSSPWIYTGSCIGGSSTDLRPPFCRAEKSPFLIIPSDSVETGTFFCTCLGARCNREFEIDLDDFVTSTSATTTMPVTAIKTVSISTTIMTLSEITPSTVAVKPTSLIGDDDGECMIWILVVGPEMFMSKIIVNYIDVAVCSTNNLCMVIFHQW